MHLQRFTFLAAFATLHAVAQVHNASPSSHSIVLTDNFTKWTTSSAFLTALASASSCTPATFVAPQLGFSSQSGLQMSGPTEDYQTTGIQSSVALSPPFTVTTTVMATRGTGIPFEIFLSSADLSQYLTVTDM